MFAHRKAPLLARVLASLTVVALLAGITPVAASAVTISAPANVLATTNVQASLSASDQAGLAVLFLDGSPIRSLTVTSGPFAFQFPSIPLAAGSHRFKLLVRTKQGTSESPARDVVSWRKPVPPVLIAPTGGYAGKTTNIIAKAGPSTSALKLVFNGRTISTKAARPGQIVSLGSVSLNAGVNTAQIIASNPCASTSGTFSIRRLEYPWPTCIIVDKSEYKLYWIRNGSLVKTYPVAIGKPSTPTPARVWRIDAKYEYPEWGVYGPRRMRLFKQVGSSFEYTGYGIHGTNEEWVIGTMASHGCIRMYNRDVLELYPQVPMHTMVLTRE